MCKFIDLGGDNMLTILVCGGAGYIGSHMVAELLEIAFCGEENEPEEIEGSELVSICGQPLNDYLAMNEAI